VYLPRHNTILSTGVVSTGYREFDVQRDRTMRQTRWIFIAFAAIRKDGAHPIAGSVVGNSLQRSSCAIPRCGELSVSQVTGATITLTLTKRLSRKDYAQESVDDTDKRRLAKIREHQERHRAPPTRPCCRRRRHKDRDGSIAVWHIPVAVLAWSLLSRPSFICGTYNGQVRAADEHSCRPKPRTNKFRIFAARCRVQTTGTSIPSLQAAA